MNIIKTIYDIVKQSYDEYWVKYEEVSKMMTPEERMVLYDTLYNPHIY